MALTSNMFINVIRREMNARRERGETVFLQSHLDEFYPDFSSDAPEYRLNKYYYEMGINYNNATVKNVIDKAKGDPLYLDLWKETILPAIHEGLYTEADYKDYISFTKNDVASIVTQPYWIGETVNSSLSKKGAATPAGVAFDESSIDAATKMTAPQKFGDTISFNYETIKDIALDVLGQFLIVYLKKTAQNKLLFVIDTAINGDNAIDTATKESVDSSAPVIGVIDTGKGFQFDDIQQLGFRMNRLGMTADTITATEDNNRLISNMPEFKLPYAGQPLHSFKIRGQNPLPGNGNIVNAIGGDRLLFTNKAGCMIEHVNQGLMVEQEKIATKQVINIVYSERISFINFFRSAKAVLDKTKAFSEYGFPSWFDIQK